MTPEAIQELQVYLNKMYGQVEQGRGAAGHSIKYNHTYQNACYSNQNYDYKTTIKMF